MNKNNIWFGKFISSLWIFGLLFTSIGITGSFVSELRQVDAEIGLIDKPTNVIGKYIVNLFKPIEANAQFAVTILKDIDRTIENVLKATIKAIIGNFISGIIGQIVDIFKDFISGFLQNWIDIFKDLPNYVQGYNLSLALQAFAIFREQNDITKSLQQLVATSKEINIFTENTQAGTATIYEAFNTLSDGVTLVSFMAILDYLSMGSPVKDIVGLLNRSSNSLVENEGNESASLTLNTSRDRASEIEDKMKQIVNGSKCSDYNINVYNSEITPLFGVVNGCKAEQLSKFDNMMTELKNKAKTVAESVQRNHYERAPDGCKTVGYIEDNDSIDFAYDINTDLGKLGTKFIQASSNLKPREIEPNACALLSKKDDLTIEAAKVVNVTSNTNLDNSAEGVVTSMKKEVTTAFNKALEDIKNSTVGLITKAVEAFKDNFSISAFNTIQYITTKDGGVASQIDDKLKEVRDRLNTSFISNVDEISSRT